MYRVLIALCGLACLMSTQLAQAIESARLGSSLAIIGKAYETVRAGQPVVANKLLMTLVDDGSTDPLSRGFAYTALADIQKYMESGEPQPFDGITLSTPGNTFEDVVTRSASSEAMHYLHLAEAAFLSVNSYVGGPVTEFSKSNMYFQLASVYGRMPDQLQLCDALKQSLDWHLRGIEKFPNAQLGPGGSAGFRALIDYRKQRQGCPK